MRRLTIVLLLACLALPAGARAQSGSAFGPLPQPVAPVETATPVQNPADQSTIGRGVLFGIAGVVLVAFIAIGLYISRDARQHLTEDDRRSLERERAVGAETAKVRDERAKKKARAKARAQRQARKKQRSR